MNGIERRFVFFNSSIALKYRFYINGWLSSFLQTAQKFHDFNTNQRLAGLIVEVFFVVVVGFNVLFVLQISFIIFRHLCGMTVWAEQTTFFPLAERQERKGGPKNWNNSLSIANKIYPRTKRISNTMQIDIIHRHIASAAIGRSGQYSCMWSVCGCQIRKMWLRCIIDRNPCFPPSTECMNNKMDGLAFAICSWYDTKREGKTSIGSSIKAKVILFRHNHLSNYSPKRNKAINGKSSKYLSMTANNALRIRTREMNWKEERYLRVRIGEYERRENEQNKPNRTLTRQRFVSRWSLVVVVIVYLAGLPSWCI